jgi:hypothetical protein
LRFTMTDLSLAGTGLALILSLVAPYALDERASNEMKAKGLLNDIKDEQARVYGGKPADARFYARNFDDLAACGFDWNAPVINNTVTRDGYLFVVAPLDDGPAPLRWCATATPLRFGETGGQAYYIDERGTLRAAAAPFAGPTSPEAN